MDGNKISEMAIPRNITSLDQLWQITQMGIFDLQSNLVDGLPSAIATRIVGQISDLANQTKEVNNLDLGTNLAVNRPLVPVEIELVSDDAGDTGFYQIACLDADKNYFINIVQATGLTPVALGLNFRVLNIRNASGVTLPNGSKVPSKTTIGNVVLREVGASGTPASPGVDYYAKLTPLLNLGSGTSVLIPGERAFTGGSTVPKGYRGFAKDFHVFTSKGDAVEVSVQAKPSESTVWTTEVPASALEGFTDFDQNWIEVPELYDLRVIAKQAAGAGTVPVEVHYQLLFVKI